ncbi:MAG TPA: phytoene synthase, partial [Corynebacterium variabile]|nr:phytoene synthase [Corynebacterium variabile]
MRADLAPRVHDDASLAEYIHGSAEVIGLMCLDIFRTHGDVTADPQWLAEGAASLGSAFQKVN